MQKMHLTSGLFSETKKKKNDGTGVLFLYSKCSGFASLPDNHTVRQKRGNTKKLNRLVSHYLSLSHTHT